MRHHNANRTFGRERKVRIALIRGLLRALIMEGKIMTTEAKAKEIRPAVEKLITTARKGDLASRRLVISRLASAETAKVLCDEIAPRYAKRAGGYTRITKLGKRLSDSAPQAMIEFV